MAPQRLSNLADVPLWHQLPGVVIAQPLGVNPEQGLAEREAHRRLREYGANE
ncbi:MAG: cation-transporting P-type ATPase [Cyanobacteriota bacterium]|nr:cation-transporting P-type ATPase [Cyanobacteriota bacterium]